MGRSRRNPGISTQVDAIRDTQDNGKEYKRQKNVMNSEKEALDASCGNPRVVTGQRPRAERLAKREPRLHKRRRASQLRVQSYKTVLKSSLFGSGTNFLLASK